MPSSPRPLDPDALLEEGARALGLCLTSEQLDRFRAYRDELLRWGGRMSLTALRSPEAIVREGFLDSLACVPLVGPDVHRAVDLGSGAGFPGIPLSLVRPAVRFTLVEASRKKTTFLRHILRTLQLNNATVLTGRAELLAADPALAGTFDLALARAVARPPQQARLARPFLRAGGVFVLQAGSGPPAPDAWAAIAEAGFVLERAMAVPPLAGLTPRRLLVWRRPEG